MIFTIRSLIVATGDGAMRAAEAARRLPRVPTNAVASSAPTVASPETRPQPTLEVHVRRGVNTTARVIGC